MTPTPLTPLVTVSGLGVVRSGRTVLHDISLELQPGRIQVLIGPNGSGKSSLAMAVCGLLPPAAGTVMVQGLAIARLPPRERARLVAYVPQHSELTSALSVQQVVAMGRFAHDGTWGRDAAHHEAVTEALRQVDALDLALRPVTELSGGEMQRVLIARALATRAGILILDEPSSALDVAHRLGILRLLRRLAGSGKAVLVALHDLNEAVALADQVVLLQAGRILAQGTPQEVISPAHVRSAYGVSLVPGGGFGYALEER
jgi:iron complex transport system ATP-binding protein